VVNGASVIRQNFIRVPLLRKLATILLTSLYLRPSCRYRQTSLSASLSVCDEDVFYFFTAFIESVLFSLVTCRVFVSLWWTASLTLLINVYLHIPLPSLAVHTDRAVLPCNHTQRLFVSCCIVCHLDFGDDIGRVLTTVLLYRKVSEPWGWKYHYTFQHIFSKTFAALLTKTFLESRGWKNIPKYLQLFSLMIHTSKQYKNT
jgi:hypothetical protein